jgi:hypothetical protein
VSFNAIAYREWRALPRLRARPESSARPG